MTADRDVETLLRIARRAERVVMDVYQSAFEVELKGPGDPVTRADREANVLICDALATSFPSAAVIAEESAPTSTEELARLTAREDVFFVDPVDGTREFAQRNGEFCVMIGRASAGHPTMGVVLVPATGDAFVGHVGHGAFVERGDGRREPLVPSACAELTNARLVVSRSHQPRVAEHVREDLGITGAIRCGSVGLKVAKVAAGEAELYVHGTRGVQLWDVCAPDALLRAAGGSFTDLSGAAIDYRGSLAVRRGVVGTTAPLRERVLAATSAFYASLAPSADD